MDKPGEPSSIPLYVVAGTATVWDAQTVATLHCAHDISGLRAGTLPGVVQQNAFLGLPFTLMKEEAAALVNKGAAHFVPLATRLTPPFADVVAERTAARVARTRALATRMREEDEARSKAAAEKYAVVGEAARAKRAARSRKRAEAARAAGIAKGDEGVEEAYVAAIAAIEAEGKEVKVKVEEKEKPTPIPTAENTNIFTVVPALPVHETLIPSTRTVMGGDVFPFPRSTRDRALVGTFAALQGRGLRMGLGPRFGGEWLVYPGDYLRYHAHFTSQVVVRDEPILPTQLVAWGRLGTGTKKAGLICCWDDEGDEEGEGEVEFYSLEWSNFG